MFDPYADAERLSERCDECGHYLDAHDQAGCIAEIESSTGEWKPCNCQVSSRQGSLL